MEHKYRQLLGDRQTQLILYYLHCGCKFEFDKILKPVYSHSLFIHSKTFLSVFQLIGMLLACCLSRIITANQYEMV